MFKCNGNPVIPLFYRAFNQCCIISIMQPVNTFKDKNESRLSPSQILIVKGLEKKRLLIEESGGILSISEVLSATGWSNDQLMYKWFIGSVLGMELIGDIAFPRFQFESGKIIDGLEDVNILLNKDSICFWSCCLFLLNNHDFFGSNPPLSPLNAIKNGRKDEVFKLVEARFDQIAY